MNEKDKILLQDSALIVADGIVSNIAGLNIAWGLSKALYGSGIKLREKRALEWVETIKDNPNIFTKNILCSQNFQDGFVYAFEKFIKERNNEKRKIIKNIFLGFSKSKDLENFELERFINIASLLSIKDFRWLSGSQYASSEEEKKYYKNALAILISLGIIELNDIYNSTDVNRLKDPALAFDLTDFGEELRKFIEK